MRDLIRNDRDRLHLRNLLLEGDASLPSEPADAAYFEAGQVLESQRKVTTMANAAIEIPRQELIALCRRNHIRRLSLFGSVLRDDFGADSDVDVLVEFEEGHVPGLRFFALQRELSELLGHAVDLNTPGFLSPHFRWEVLAEAEIQYDAA